MIANKELQYVSAIVKESVNRKEFITVSIHIIYTRPVATRFRKCILIA